MVFISSHESEKYMPLIDTLQSTNTEVKFINLAMNALVAIDNSWGSLLSMLKDLGTLCNLKNCLISKMMCISIWCTYYHFCRRDKDWTDPALMNLCKYSNIVFCDSLKHNYRYHSFHCIQKMESSTQFGVVYECLSVTLCIPGRLIIINTNNCLLLNVMQVKKDASKAMLSFLKSWLKLWVKIEHGWLSPWNCYTYT